MFLLHVWTFLLHFCLWTLCIYFERDVATFCAHHFTQNVSALCDIVQCICAFEHSKFFIPVTQYFSLNLESISLPVNQDLQKGKIKQSTTIFVNWISQSWSQTLLWWHVYNYLFYVCIKSDCIHFNGSEQCVERTYSGTKVLSSYPPF